MFEAGGPGRRLDKSGNRIKKPSLERAVGRGELVTRGKPAASATDTSMGCRSPSDMAFSVYPMRQDRCHSDNKSKLAKAGFGPFKRRRGGRCGCPVNNVGLLDRVGRTRVPEWDGIGARGAGVISVRCILPKDGKNGREGGIEWEQRAVHRIAPLFGGVLLVPDTRYTEITQ